MLLSRRLATLLKLLDCDVCLNYLQFVACRGSMYTGAYVCTQVARGSAMQAPVQVEQPSVLRVVA